MLRTMRRVVVVAGALIVLYFIGGSVVGAAVLGFLLTPGNVDWSGAGRPSPDNPFELGFRGDPLQGLGLAFETVRYTGELGEAEAWLVPAEQPSELWAVYVHGIGGIRENGYRQLAILHEAGIPMLMITYRHDAGAPRDARPFFSFGLNEWRDLDAAVSWTLENGGRRIVLVAESMGGAIAGQFLMRSQQSGAVTALVLDAPALDVPGVIESFAAQAWLPFPEVLATNVLWLLGLAAPLQVGDAVSMEAVAAFPGPLFLAHGSGDRLVPIAISEQLLQRRRAPTVFLRTNADHLRSFMEDPERYRQELLSFLASLTAN